MIIHCVLREVRIESLYQMYNNSFLQMVNGTTRTGSAEKLCLDLKGTSNTRPETADNNNNNIVLYYIICNSLLLLFLRI